MRIPIHRPPESTICYFIVSTLLWSISLNTYSMQSLKYTTAEKVGMQLLIQSSEHRTQTLSKIPQELHDTIKKMLINKCQVPLVTTLDEIFYMRIDYPQAARAIQCIINDNPYTSLEEILNIENLSDLLVQKNRELIREEPFDNNLTLVDLNTNQRFNFFGHTDAIFELDISADGKYALTGSQDTTARLWNIDTQQSTVLSGHTAPIIGVSLNPNTKQAITASEDGAVRIWDISQPHPLCTATIEHSSAIAKIHINYTSNLLIVALENGTILVYTIAQTAPLYYKSYTLNEPIHITTITLSNDNRFVLAGSRDGHIILWDLDLEHTIRFKVFDNPIWKTGFIKLYKEDITYCIAAHSLYDEKLHIYKIPETLNKFSLEEIITRIQQL